MEIATKDVDDLMDDDLFWFDTESDLQAILNNYTAQMAIKAYTFGAGKLGLEYSFSEVNERVKEFAAAYTNEWWDTLSVTMHNELRQALVDYAAGDIGSLPELQARLEGTFGVERAKRIAATETTRIFAEGNMMAYRDAKVTHVEWHTVGGLAAGADQPCVDAEANGPYEIEKAPMPPLHVNCLAGDTLVSAGGGITARYGREYEGLIVTLTTARGHKITATPNHPILTPQGFVAAGSLAEGSDVLTRLALDSVGFDNVHDHDSPAPIRKLFEAAGQAQGMLSREVPVTPEQFHGDGAHGKVAVVRADRKLWDRLQSGRLQHSKQLGFAGVGARLIDLVRPSTALHLQPALLGATHGSVGRGNLRGTLLAGHVTPLQSFRSGLVAGRDASGVQATVDSPPVHAEVVREAINRLAGEITLDHIVSIERNTVRTHVYNLEARYGYIVAAGFVTGNCRCWLSPVTVAKAPVEPQQPKPSRTRAQAAQPTNLPPAGGMGRTRATGNYADMERARKSHIQRGQDVSDGKNRENAKRKIMEDIGARLAANPQWMDQVREYAIREKAMAAGRTDRYYAEAVTDDWIRNWAGTSADTDPLALALQLAAKEEFALRASTVIDDYVAATMGGRAFIKAEELYATHGGAMRAFLRAMYENTQAAFAADGITSITLVRGMHFDDRTVPMWARRTTNTDARSQWHYRDTDLPTAYAPGQLASDTEIMLFPMSSFSTNTSTSKGFANYGDHMVGIYADIPVDRIIGTARSGFGCLNEYEFVVLDGYGDWTVWNFG